MSKASKLRDCPALGRTIAVPECGGQRQTSIACTADCPHNPFSLLGDHYERSLEIEDRLNSLTVKRLASEAPDSSSFISQLDAAVRSGGHGENAFMTWQIFFEKDAAQTTFAQRWQQTGFSGLKNDEAVFMRAKMQMRVALVEVHRVLPDGLLEVVDLLSASPEPLLLRDNSMAKRAVRFTTMLAWIYPMPHYWRSSGTAFPISDIATLPATDVVREIALHLGSPADEENMRRWLAKNFQRVADSLDATCQARRTQMLTNIDAKWGQAVYELKNTNAHCRQRLDALRDVAPDDLAPEERKEGFTTARVWFDSQPPPENVAASYSASAGGKIMLGRVLLSPKRWRLETMGAEKMARLRNQFEARMGERVRFVSERIDDLGKRQALEIPDVDNALVPPRLLENPNRVFMASSCVPELPGNLSPQEYEQQMRAAYDRAFMDDKIPALDNRTPREASADPTLRPKLLQLVKIRVRDQDRRNLEKGRDDDINWMLRELGLTEILFDAPPHREPPVDMDADDEDDEWDDETDDDLPNYPAHATASSHRRDQNTTRAETRPPAPRLTGEPMSSEEAAERINTFMSAFATAAEAADELDASGATIISDVGDLTMEHLDDNGISMCVPFLLQAWYALVPRECRAPKIDFATLKSTFRSNLLEFQMMGAQPSAHKCVELMTSGTQPGLMAVLLSELFSASRSASAKKIGIQFPDILVIAAMLKSVVTCLDASLRRS